ncbi:serine protease [Rhodococcus sp. WS4]|nr:serine protease [Rhodococcus sp. WS4]
MDEDEANETIGNEQLYRALRLRVENYGSGNIVTYGHGTGFIVRSHSGSHYLVTNRHVVDRRYLPQDRKKWSSRGLASIEINGFFQNQRDDEPTPQRTSLTIVDPTPVFPYSEDIDLAVIVLPNVGTKSLDLTFNNFDITLIEKRRSIIRGEVQVGSPLLMPGYPELGGGVSERPILVGGWIASDPRYSASYAGNDYPRRVLGHSFSREGMSGAPVLSLSADFRGALIA